MEESPPSVHPSPSRKKAKSKKDNSSRIDALEFSINSIQKSIANISQALVRPRQDSQSFSEYSLSEDEEISASPFLGHDARYPLGKEQIPNCHSLKPTDSATPQVPSSSSSFLNPCTTLKEPDIKDPEPEILESLFSCQQLGTPNWNAVRYAEAESRLKRGSAFQPLVMNNLFANQSSSIDYGLRRQERLLGTLTYGLLAQRKAFAEAQAALIQRCPSAEKAFEECFSDDSKFCSVTQDLLQFVCGKRAEILAERRKTVEPSDKGSKKALLEIPPSLSHVFDEEKLAKWVSDPTVKVHRNQKNKKRFLPETSSGPSSYKRVRPSPSSPPDFKVRPVVSSKVKKSFPPHRSSKENKGYIDHANKFPSGQQRKGKKPFRHT